MLDNRLNKIAELVSGEGIAVDVGTDHAYLAAELVRSGKCSRVIASDVKEGPLDSARNTVEKYGVQDRVELVLSDGLQNVDLNGVTDIVIAGMGGETIAEIIGSSAADKPENIRFILQPMTKIEILRKKLYEYQYEITEEYAVDDKDKIYVIIVAERGESWKQLTESDALYGFFDDSDDLVKEFRKREAERLARISNSLASAGDRIGAQHYDALSYKMKNGTDIVSIADVYSFLDSVYPFALQEKWDNSGLLVENYDMECSRILLTLDITNMAVNEAFEKGAELIISHHPVIFDPRKKITRDDPVFRLIERGIAAICMHTNLDIANGGTNGVILGKLTERLGIEGTPETFEELGGGNNLGWIIELKEAIDAKKLAEVCKVIFGCEVVRFTKKPGMIKRIAFCSGSGGSDLGTAVEKGCDAYITGDVKHDVWIDANNSRIALLDCGHFHTENLVLWELRRVLEEKFPQLDVEIAETSADPCEYV